MAENVSRTSVAGLLVATAAACAVFAFWAASPDNGEWNLLFTATAIAFIVALLMPRGIFLGLFAGAGFIVISLLVFIPQDPSGLGPPWITIPIQLTIAVVPMIGAAWLGRKLRARLSLRPKRPNG